MTEREKYTGIYSSGKIAGYGHENCGGASMPIVIAMSPKSILDVGCGYNEFAFRCSRRIPGIRAVGVDFACPGADIIAEASRLPFVFREFDLLTSFDTLEHLIEDEVPETLLEFARVSSRFIFSICYRKSVFLYEGHNLHPTVRPEEWWIERIVESGGVDVEKKKRYIHGRWS